MLETHPLSNFLKWSSHPDRREAFLEIFDAHFLSMYEDHGMTFEDIESVLGSRTMMTLISCVLEDVLSRTFAPEYAGLVDSYLKLRGWKLSVATRRYIQAVRKSCMSLYEITDIEPGRFLQVRDLLRGGEALEVEGGPAMRNLATGDAMGARIITPSGRPILADGLLPFAPATARNFIGEYHLAVEKARAEVGRMEQALGSPATTSNEVPFEEQFLATCAGIFTSVWISDAVASVQSRCGATTVQ